jgi:phosphatidylglycerol:prolipoprotein diacylglycerol transferase
VVEPGAVIPHLAQPTLHLGPITIHAFGVLVAIAMIVGMRIVRTRAEAGGLDGALADRMVTWILLGGFAGAHLVDRLVYNPAETLQEPWRLLKFWEGLSSFGGFIGAVVGAVLFFRKVDTGRDRWRYLDCVAYGFPFGWIFGRLGCSIAFDHPGRETRFFLSEVYQDGKVRHNLGLDEALYTILLALLFYVLGRKPRRPGFFVGLLALLYAPVRFAFDFLRIVDVRYFGLTPGQWGTMGLVVVGVVILRRKDEGEAEAPPSTTSG